jgi:hypothetical protein
MFNDDFDRSWFETRWLAPPATIVRRGRFARLLAYLSKPRAPADVSRSLPF